MLIGNASMALSMNKHSGRTDKVFVEDEIKAKILAMNELEKQIPIAMEKHEFRPFYQPKMSASQNKIVGAEALARWIKEEHPLEELNKLVDYLHRRGISVAIDDFGTGSSSINLLRAVEFDILKIDKSFVDNSTERDEKVLKRIITIAKDIGFDIIAEGVESEEQLENLTGLGCDNIQGFYYAKPLPKEEFETYIGGKN